MCIFVGVEDIGNGDLAHSNDQPVCRLRSSELIRAGFDFLTFSTQIDRLANKRARQSRIGKCLSDLIGFSTWKSRNAERIGETEALIDLGVDP